MVQKNDDNHLQNDLQEEVMIAYKFEKRRSDFPHTLAKFQDMYDGPEGRSRSQNIALNLWITTLVQFIVYRTV